jgi:hypothetical protein
LITLLGFALDSSEKQEAVTFLLVRFVKIREMCQQMGKKRDGECTPLLERYVQIPKHLMSSG